MQEIILSYYSLILTKGTNNEKKNEQNRYGINWTQFNSHPSMGSGLFKHDNRRTLKSQGHHARDVSRGTYCFPAGMAESSTANAN
jgi:hypothetical protein